MVCTIVTYRARNAVREVAKALGFPPEGDRCAGQGARHPRRRRRGARPGARRIFAWLFDELGIDMADAAVPPGRDGRGERDGLVQRHRTRRGTTGRGRSSIPLRVRSARAAGCRRSGRGCSTHRSRRCVTRRPRRSGTRGRASWPARSCGCRSRATTARRGRRAGGRRWCGSTRSRGCSSRSGGGRRVVPEEERAAPGAEVAPERPAQSVAVAPHAVRRDRRLPAPPRHPRRRHARHPHRRSSTSSRSSARPCPTGS